jgi:hypothetical protein
VGAPSGRCEISILTRRRVGTGLLFPDQRFPVTGPFLYACSSHTVHLVGFKIVLGYAAEISSSPPAAKQRIWKVANPIQSSKTPMCMAIRRFMLGMLKSEPDQFPSKQSDSRRMNLTTVCAERRGPNTHHGRYGRPWSLPVQISMDQDLS